MCRSHHWLKNYYIDFVTSGGFSLGSCIHVNEKESSLIQTYTVRYEENLQAFKFELNASVITR